MEVFTTFNPKKWLIIYSLSRTYRLQKRDFKFSHFSKKAELKEIQNNIFTVFVNGSKIDGRILLIKTSYICIPFNAGNDDHEFLYFCCCYCIRKHFPRQIFMIALLKMAAFYSFLSTRFFERYSLKRRYIQ